MQAVSCVALIAVSLLGGGVFFYYAQTIALNELKAQSDFIRKAVNQSTRKPAN
jgi:hypothetical protein